MAPRAPSGGTSRHRGAEYNSLHGAPLRGPEGPCIPPTTLAHPPLWLAVVRLTPGAPSLWLVSAQVGGQTRCWVGRCYGGGSAVRVGHAPLALSAAEPGAEVSAVLPGRARRSGPLGARPGPSPPRSVRTGPGVQPCEPARPRSASGSLLEACARCKGRGAVRPLLSCRASGCSCGLLHQADRVLPWRRAPVPYGIGWTEQAVTSCCPMVGALQPSCCLQQFR